MSRNENPTLCTCGRRAAGIDAETRSPSCRKCAESTTTDDESTDRRRAIADGGIDLDAGIQHHLDSLPPDFADISRESQQAIVGGFSRAELIALIREIIGSETKTKTDRLAKHELVELLIILEEVMQHG